MILVDTSVWVDHLRCEIIGERDGHRDRRSIGETGDVRQPAHRRGWSAEAGLVAVRSVLAVARDAHQDNIRVGGLQGLIAEIPALERAWAKVFDDGVAPFDELQEQLATGQS